MKKAMIIVLAVILIFPTACSKRKEAASRSSIPSSTDKDKSIVSSQDNTSNKIIFQAVDSSKLPESLLEQINKLKKERGFTYYLDESNDYLYIAVFMGEKNTGGYSISVVNVEEEEDKIKLKVLEKIPDGKQMVTMALTQPYTVIRIKSTKTNIIVENQSGIKINQITND